MRKRIPGRLVVIADAALEAFTRRGYRLTQMTDAARLAGVSAGTLYLYAENKEALFELALRSALGLLPEEVALPLRAAGRQKSMRLLADAVAARDDWPILKAALAGKAPADMVAEVEAIFGELFDAVTRQRRLIWLLDACAWDVPELARAFGEKMRGAYFADATAYVERRRREDRLSREGSAVAITRGVVEATVWFALDRPRDPAPTGIGDDDAREAACLIASGALLAAPIAGPQSPSARRRSAAPARPP